jgi:hypothetical protein
MEQNGNGGNANEDDQVKSSLPAKNPLRPFVFSSGILDSMRRELFFLYALG